MATQQTDREGDTRLAAFGERVRGWRARRGMTRRALAAAAGVSERHLAQVEAGHGNLSLRLLWRVAEALHVDAARLLSDVPPAAAELEALLAGLDESGRQEALALLRRHLRRGRSVHGVALVGVRGAGKSTLGQALAQRLGWPFVRLGEVIEQLAGLPLPEVFSLGGQAAYRRFEREAIDRVAATHQRCVLEAGGSVVSEAESWRALLGAFRTVWVRASAEEHMARVLAQGDLRPMGGNPQAMADLRRILAEREPAYRSADAVIDTTGRTVDECVGELLEIVTGDRLPVTSEQ